MIEYAALISVGAFLLGSLTTAVIRSWVARFFSRARPSIRLTSISLGPDSSSEDNAIKVEISVKSKFDSNPALPEYPKEETVCSFRKYVIDAKRNLDSCEEIMKFLHALLDRSHLLDSTLSIDQQRIKFLREWSAYYSELAHWAKGTIKEFAKDIPEQYKQPHPEGWKDLAKAMVLFDNNKVANLSEIDEDAYVQKEIESEGTQAREEALRTVSSTNAYRRYFIYLDEHHLRWLLSKTHEQMNTFVNDAKEMIVTLESMIRTTTPDYLRVTAIISNDGSLACAVKSVAYLRLPNVDPITRDSAFVPLIVEVSKADRNAPSVIKGGDAVQFTLRSEIPVSSMNITKQDGSVLLDGQRLQSLYSSQIVSCNIAFSLTGFGLNHSVLIVSDPYDFGLPANTRDRESLMQALKNQLN